MPGTSGDSQLCLWWERSGCWMPGGGLSIEDEWVAGRALRLAGDSGSACLGHEVASWFPGVDTSLSAEGL